MKKNIFIFFITSSVIIVIGSFLYINSNSEIPTIYPPDGPIRELPKILLKLKDLQIFLVFTPFGITQMNPAAHLRVFLKRES